MPEKVKTRSGLHQVTSMNLDILLEIGLNIRIAIVRENIRGSTAVKLVKDTFSDNQYHSRVFAGRRPLKNIYVHEATARNIEPLIAAADFFTTEVWTWRGLVTYYTVFVIDLASRCVQILGSRPHPKALLWSRSSAH